MILMLNDNRHKHIENNKRAKYEILSQNYEIKSQNLNDEIKI